MPSSKRRKLHKPGPPPVGSSFILTEHPIDFRCIVDGCKTPHQIAQRLAREARYYERMAKRKAKLTETVNDGRTSYTLPGHWQPIAGDDDPTLTGPCRSCEWGWTPLPF